MHNPIPDSPPSGCLAWLRRHPYTVLTLLFVIGAGGTLVQQRSSEWDDVYVAAASRLVAGEDLYTLQGAFFYLPFSAVWALPFTYLDPLPARIVWVGLNMLAVVALAWAAWRTAGGECVEQPGTSWREHVILVFGLLLSFRFVWNGLVHLQTDAVIGAVLLLGCLALVSGRRLTGALLLGVSAAVKSTPLLFGAYFVWRRQWRLALGMVAVTAGLNLLPDLIARPAHGGFWVKEWVTRCVAPLSKQGMYVGMWCTDPIANQSLAGTAYRCLITQPRATEGVGRVAHRADAMSPQALALGLRAFQGVLGLSVLAVMILARRRLGDSSGDASPMHLATEFSIVIVMMLLLSPMSGKAHFGILLLPAFCLARQALERRRPALIAVLLIAGALSLVTMKELVGATLANRALWLGSLTALALTMLAGLCYALATSGKNGSVIDMKDEMDTPLQQAA